MFSQIYEIDTLQQLREYLTQSSDCEKVRTYLLAEFLKYSRYRNAAEWNMAVRLCECLAIIGWGETEPLEAIRGTYFNGNPNTFFVNRNAEFRYLNAVWSKRKNGIAIDFGSSSFLGSPDAPSIRTPISGDTISEVMPTKLNSQRNWIPKNPICITRGIANCYENSRSVIESMEKDLKPTLNQRMRPELYGGAINQIIINCSFSFYDNYHCKTNYIIADEALGLKQKDFYSALLGMFPKKEIEDNGYYLRNRFTCGPFRFDTGLIRVGVVLEKEFSKHHPLRQKQVLSEYFLHAVDLCAKRLCKKIDYDFRLMTADFTAILKEWCEKQTKDIAISL